MNPRQIRKQWRRALTANLNRTGELLGRRGPLNAEAVHDFRVALRHLRLLLQLRNKQRDRQRTKRFRATARRIMDAFAPVRDIDVTLEWVRAAHVSPALLTQLLRERMKVCRRAERQIKQLRQKVRPSRLKTVGKVDALKLARRFDRWLQAMETRCRKHAGRAVHLSTAQLHVLRRDIRRWRYLRELLVPRRKPYRDSTVHTLITAQAALGAIQDVEVVLTSLWKCGRSREVTQLKRQLQADLLNSHEAALPELARLAVPSANRS